MLEWQVSLHRAAGPGRGDPAAAALHLGGDAEGSSGGGGVTKPAQLEL